MIPIFPLNLVVFPESKYPLHIFEERYKKMVSRCLEENSGFGMVTQINDQLSKVGSYLNIVDVIKRYVNGEMDIVVEGKGRFIITNLDLHMDGYFIGNIEEYSDVPSVIDPILLEELHERFEKIIDKFNFHLDEFFWSRYKQIKSKSFKLAEKAGLSIEQQQELLVLQDENKRITFLIDHFEKLDEQISKNASLKNIILNNGYIN